MAESKPTFSNVFFELHSKNNSNFLARQFCNLQTSKVQTQKYSKQFGREDFRYWTIENNSVLHTSRKSKKRRLQTINTRVSRKTKLRILHRGWILTQCALCIALLFTHPPQTHLKRWKVVNRIFCWYEFVTLHPTRRSGAGCEWILSRNSQRARRNGSPLARNKSRKWTNLWLQDR